MAPSRTRWIRGGLLAFTVLFVAFDVPSAQASAAPGVGSPAGTSCNVSNEGVVSKFVAGNACVALEGLLPFIGQALGQPTIQMFDEVHLIFSATPDADPGVEMFTNFWDNDHAKFFSNVQEPCQITVYPIAWSGQADTSLSPEFRVLLAHEVVHCYQNAIVGAEHAFTPGPSGRSLPKWISEGSATYIATTLLGIEEPGTPSFWNKGNLGWLGAPNTQLDTRSYDAIGWYSLVSKLTGSDLYGLFPTAWKDYSTDGFNTSKFIKDMGGDATTVMQAWGASLVNEPSWGDAWTTPGFGVPSGPPTETSDTIQGDNVPYHQDVVPLGGLVDSEGAVSDGLVEISTDQGYTSVHDSADHSYLAFTNEVFCLKDACANKHVVCPGALAPVPLLEIVPPFVVSTAGSNKAAVVTMEHIPAPKSNKGNLVLPSSAGPCKPTPLPPPPKTAFSEGDPHLQALDGAAFDFQGVGEYQLVHNVNGQVVVQTRSAPAAGSNSVSWNTAVAMMVGSDRVEVDAASPVVVLLNGMSATFPKSGPLTLKGGGTVTRVPDGDFADVTVTWPDGSRNDIFADARGENSTFTPPATGVDDFTGLLAAPTGAKVPKGASPGSIALAGGDGKTYVLDPTTKAGFATLYGSFAMSWKVTKTNSLFTYAKGKGVGSYDIAGFPKQLVSLDTLGAAAKAVAETKCKAQGITDPKLLADCELDVAETGATDLAAATARVQQVAAGIAPPQATATTHASSYYFTKPCAVVDVADIAAALGSALPENLGAGGTCVIGASPIDSITFSHQSSVFFAVLAATATSTTPEPSLGHGARCITGPLGLPNQSYVIATLGNSGTLEVLAGSCTQATALTRRALSHISGI